MMTVALSLEQKASILWGQELFRRALLETDDLAEAEGAAHLALSVEPSPPESILLAVTPRSPGPFQGPSGRWFTKHESGAVSPMTPPDGTHPSRRWPRKPDEPAGEVDDLLENLHDLLADESNPFRLQAALDLLDGKAEDKIDAQFSWTLAGKSSRGTNIWENEQGARRYQEKEPGTRGKGKEQPPTEQGGQKPPEVAGKPGAPEKKPEEARTGEQQPAESPSPAPEQPAPTPAPPAEPLSASLEVKNGLRFHEGRVFNGVARDAMNRRICFAAGIRSACPGADGKPRGKVALRPSMDEVRESLAAFDLAITMGATAAPAEEVAKVANLLQRLRVVDLQAIRKERGGKYARVKKDILDSIRQTYTPDQQPQEGPQQPPGGQEQPEATRTPPSPAGTPSGVPQTQEQPVPEAPRIQSDVDVSQFYPMERPTTPQTHEQQVKHIQGGALDVGRKLWSEFVAQGGKLFQGDFFNVPVSALASYFPPGASQEEKLQLIQDAFRRNPGDSEKFHLQEPGVNRAQYRSEDREHWIPTYTTSSGFTHYISDIKVNPELLQGSAQEQTQPVQTPPEAPQTQQQPASGTGSAPAVLGAVGSDILDLARDPRAGGLVSLVDLAKKTGLVTQTLHEVISNLQKAGAISLQPLEGRHGISAEEQATAMDVPGIGRVGYVTVRDPAKLKQALARQGAQQPQQAAAPPQTTPPPPAPPAAAPRAPQPQETANKEQSLYHRAAAGDVKARNQLIEAPQTQQKITGTIGRMLHAAGIRDEATLKDLVQTVNVKLLMAFAGNKLDPNRGNFQQYTSLVTSNAVRDFFRKKKTEGAVLKRLSDEAEAIFREEGGRAGMQFALGGAHIPNAAPAALELITDILADGTPGPDGKPSDDSWGEAQQVLDWLDQQQVQEEPLELPDLLKLQAAVKMAVEEEEEEPLPPTGSAPGQGTSIMTHVGDYNPEPKNASADRQGKRSGKGKSKYRSKSGKGKKRKLPRSLRIKQGWKALFSRKP